jgi:hypothetical protein
VKKSFDILQACRDPKIFAQHFQRGRDSWNAWFVFLAALFALPMTESQLAIYQQHTGRTNPPTTPANEAWLCIGRRGGKSFMLALIAVFLACFRDWRPFLGPGELGTIMIVAQDRKQSRTIMRFVLGLLKGTPMLKKQIENVTRESVSLKNNIIVEVHTASYRSTRGYNVVAALLDEIAYWPTDEASAEPDVEVLNAIRPAMATIPGAMLLCASSPYARRGALWDAYRKHYGKDGDPILVWQAPTRTMNATVPQSFIDAHMQEDEARALAEYGAQFRTDREAFVSREAVMANVVLGLLEVSREHNVSYQAFVDPSGGSSDSMTLAIGHKDLTRKIVVLDALREVKPPFSPEAVVQEFALLCKNYGISKVVGDRYAGIWPVEMFSKHGITYEAAEKTKSELYIDLLPLINSKRIALPDHPKLINQLCGLERRTARGGRDSIDHAPNQHDDLANVVAGLASICNKYGSYDVLYRAWDENYVEPDRAPPPEPKAPPPLHSDNSNWHEWREGQIRQQRQLRQMQLDAMRQPPPLPPPQPQQPLSAADERLRQGYASLDMMFRYGR